MEVLRISEGLWRWTTEHPAWTEGDDWEPLVGCVYFEAPDAVVLIDPLVPSTSSEAERFWQALDRDVERCGRDVVVLVTCSWHARSSFDVATRYDARTVDGATLAEASLPTGVIPLVVPVADEVVWWLEHAHALVPGDTLLGTGAGALELSPASWLDSGGSIRDLANELEPALALPVRYVLPSHGEPVLEAGREALSEAIARARRAA